MPRLFTYGTLKTGQSRNHILTDIRSTLENPYAILEGYTLLATGNPARLTGFPGAIPDEGSCIHGEIWNIPETLIPYLDRIEGHPNFYRRTVLPDGMLIYVLVDTYGFTPCGESWP